MQIELSIDDSFSIEKDYRGNTIFIANVNDGNVLDHFTPTDIAKHFDHDDLLRAIGKQAAMDYWDLKEDE